MQAKNSKKVENMRIIDRLAETIFSQKANTLPARYLPQTTYPLPNRILR